MKYFAEERRKLREFAYNYLSVHHCVQCGEADPVTLEFDHLDPAKKRFNISHGIQNTVLLEILIKEINKCQILCANCHRKKTAREQGWFKFRGDHNEVAKNPG